MHQVLLLLGVVVAAAGVHMGASVDHGAQRGAAHRRVSVAARPVRLELDLGEPVAPDHVFHLLVHTKERPFITDLAAVAAIS